MDVRTVQFILNFEYFALIFNLFTYSINFYMNPNYFAVNVQYSKI